MHNELPLPVPGVELSLNNRMAGYSHLPPGAGDIHEDDYDVPSMARWKVMTIATALGLAFLGGVIVFSISW